MRSIDTSGWGEFSLDRLFEDLEPGKCSNVGVLMDGTVPYIAASTTANGFVRNVEDPGGKLTSEGNCVALICDGNGGLGLNTYQPVPFVGSSNLQLAYHSRLNEWNALFLIACLNKSVDRYNYNFAWKRRGEAFKAETVYVPVTKSGDPDWDYMARTMRSVMATQQSQLDALTKAVGSGPRLLDTESWQEFNLGMLFEIDMGSGLDFGKMVPSTDENAVAFVGRTGANNGVMGTVKRVDSAKLYETGTITVALGGSIGASFVQTRPFHTSQNVAVLRPLQPMGDGAKMFVATAIQKESSLNYKAFVRELNAHLRRDFTVPLPVASDGAPDWTYMEQRMRGVLSEREAALTRLSSLLEQ